MAIFVIIIFVLSIGGGAYFYLSKAEPYDIEKDYKEIKSALNKFRKSNSGLTKGINLLETYLPTNSDIKLDRYLLSMDDQFLIVKRFPRGCNPEAIALKIGGRSVYKDKVLRLSFATLSKGKEPVAVLNVSPINNITTTTKMEYSYKGSETIGGEVIKAEWENNKEYFTEEGNFTIKLRVMDKKQKWSKWESKDIVVIERKGIKTIEAAGDHLLVLKNNGKVLGVGENNSGQLANFGKKRLFKIEEIIGLDKIEQISTGENHTVFLKSDKFVVCVGKNNNGQLGVGDRNDSYESKLVWGLDNIIQVEAGLDFTAALTSDGFVYTWGSNESHCLGHSKKPFVSRPEKVEGVANIKEISLGNHFVLALCHDSTVMAWGDNRHGQLGFGYKTKSNDPGITILKNIKSITAGRTSSLFITNNDRVLGLGLNKVCQLGFDGEKEVIHPTEIPNLKEIEKVVFGGEFVIALDLMGKVFCWGQFTPISKSHSLIPLLNEELRYIKDIGATVSKGYVLTKDEEVIEFSTDFSEMRTLEFDKNKKGVDFSDED